MNIKKHILENPVRVRCPICDKVFEGTFGASQFFDHFTNEHKDENIHDYTPIDMELIK